MFRVYEKKAQIALVPENQRGEKLRRKNLREFKGSKMEITKKGNGRNEGNCGIPGQTFEK